MSESVEDAVCGDSIEVEVSDMKDDDSEDVPYPEHVTAEADLMESKQHDMKTIDALDNNDMSEDEQLNTKRSRELKLLLALSKEANLDTNISYKRKSIDPVKVRDVTSMSPKPGLDGDQCVKKPKVVEKPDKFPITAECELESVESGSNTSMIETPEKLKKEESKIEDISFGKERKNLKDIKVFKPDKDMFCWRCHREGVNISCETCPRAYHQKCLRQTISDVENWPCPECVTILKAESTQTRSTAMKGMTLEHLCSLLKFAVKRMIECNGSEPFVHEVNDKDFPEYKRFIAQPMTLTLLEKNIKDNLYGSTQAFEADAKWILHNSIVFNSYQSKLTTFAKTIIKICKQEMAEIENCPSCYLNANTKKATWFVEVCPKPHILVWAKLKGFPYWPAKAMCTNSSGMVDVRFFGAHDRAWVPSKECFLYSRRDPNSNKQKRNDIIECMREVEIYISNLKSLYGEFNYAPFKLPYDPDNELKQLLLFIPRYNPNAPPPKKRIRLSDSRAKAGKKEEDEQKAEESDFKDESKEFMEGYGTDDESAENETLNSSKIEGRSRRNSEAPDDSKEDLESSDSEEDEEDKVEAEVDDDTQVSSNASADVKIRDRMKTRGISNALSGKVRTTPRKISSDENPRKRLSVDEMSTPSKMSRRNSDQSIKSESSRCPSLSDKISRVDILENVELSLGNTSDSFITSSVNSPETKKKPVLMDVDNSELTISPSKKGKITDKLMKKLSSSDEDIPKLSTEGEADEVKSQTDLLLEKYKNLVKERSREFGYEEASTSFGSTSIPSSDPCESTSGEDAGELKKQIETDRKTDIGTSESDVKIGKEDNNAEVKKSVSSEMMISSTENPENVSEIAANSTLSESKSPVVLCEVRTEKINREKVIQDVPEKPVTSNETSERKDDSSAKCTPEQNDTAMKMNEQKTAIANDIVDKNKDEVLSKRREAFNPHVLRKKKPEEPTNIVSKKENSTKTTPNLVAGNHVSQSSSEDKDEKSNATSTEIKTPKKDVSELNTLVIGADKARVTPVNKTPAKEMTQKNKKIREIAQSTQNAEQTVSVSKTKVAEIIHTPDKPISSSNVAKDKLVESSYKREDKQNDKEVVMKKTEVEKNDIVVKSPEQVDSSSSDDQNSTSDDKPMNEENIRNIIHSSLNKAEESRPSQKEAIENKNVIDKTENRNRRVSSGSQVDSCAKKPRLEEVTKVPSPPKFKIVPIQSILNKAIDEKRSDQSVLTSNPILLQKLSQTDASKSVIGNSQGLVCVEIKSEPESSEEEAEEYMEKKRKYMSALNISEKTEEASVPKKNEIRTRSKTEEMGKGRHLDNLSKIIDEVATTYSAKHESRKIGDKKINQAPQVNNTQAYEEPKKASAPQENGEIFVKSFAKMAQKPQPQPRPLQQKPTANSQKPKPNHSKPIPQPIRRDTLQKPEIVPSAPLSRPASNAAPANPQIPAPVPNTTSKPMDNLGSSSNVLILTQPGVILPTSQQLTYNTGSFVTFVPSQQNMVMQSPQVINAMVASSLHPTENAQAPRAANVELHRSQNYIPQREDEIQQRPPLINPPPAAATVNGATSGPLAEVPALIPIGENASASTASSSAAANSGNAEDEFSLLHSMVPESVSRAISEVLCRPPPKLKPRPPGPLSQVFDSGNPSSAGPISAKINSISHRLGDYFRGMLIEMLEDLGKANSPEATISTLKHEIETLQHKHAAEMMDIRKNVCTILKDIQGSIVEERERLVDETRSACEVEALRRIEEAKSKQWCANCGKEAQFYCCWNTSYCDYPCQQKHWSKHMSKCTQHAGQPQPVQTPVIRPQSQITFRPATPKTFGGRIVAKPTKVYLNRTNNPKSIPTFKSSTGGHLALVDTSNLEFLSSTTMGAKFITSNSLFTKVKTVNSTVTSPSNGMPQAVVLNQKMNNTVTTSKPLPSTSNNTSNIISDEEVESE